MCRHHNTCVGIISVSELDVRSFVYCLQGYAYSSQAGGGGGDKKAVIFLMILFILFAISFAVPFFLQFKNIKAIYC